MKKTQKKILGLSGLALVTAVTIYAAFLPNPDASALSSVTDTIIVRVIGDKPLAEIISPASGSTFVSPDQVIKVNYEYAKDLDILLKYVDRDGVVHTKHIRSGAVDEETGSFMFDFSTLDDEFGFGEYTISVSGTGIDNTPIPGDSVSFLYVPVLASAAQDSETGKTYLDLDYNPYTEGETGKVDSLEINIYDDEGNLVSSISPILVDAPEKRVELPFGEHDLKSGKYRVEITAFGKGKNELYTPHNTTADYNANLPLDEDESSDIYVPDTGSLLNSLNISKVDYLITGAMFFCIVGVSAFVFILRKSKTDSKKRR